MPREFIKIELGGKTDPRWAETFYVVEATDLEMGWLHSWWHADGRVDWKELLNGTSVIKVGEDHGRSVAITVTWARIEGRLVAFWGCSSQVADYDMIEAWLTKTLRAGVHRCTADDFTLCIKAIDAANDKAPIPA
jgi:hypothetical protein